MLKTIVQKPTTNSGVETAIVAAELIESFLQMHELLSASCPVLLRAFSASFFIHITESIGTPLLSISPSPLARLHITESIGPPLKKKKKGLPCSCAENGPISYERQLEMSFLLQRLVSQLHVLIDSNRSHVAICRRRLHWEQGRNSPLVPLLQLGFRLLLRSGCCFDCFLPHPRGRELNFAPLELHRPDF
eukprot:g6521.t1